MSANKSADNNLSEVLMNENGAIDTTINTGEQLILDYENSSGSPTLGQYDGPKTFVDNTLTKGLVALKHNNKFLEKLSRVCRCCLIEGNDLKSLFDKQNSIISMLELLTPVKIVPDDGLPHNICKGCIGLLTKAVHFRQQILNADMCLRHYIAMGYIDGGELQILELEHLTKTMPNNPAMKIEKVDRNNPICNIPSEEENDQLIQHLFIQKTENSALIISNSSTHEELKEKSDKHDDNIKHQNSIEKTEVIEQRNFNKYTLEDAHLDRSSKQNNIHPIDYFFKSQTENCESIIINSSMEDKLKEKSVKHVNNIDHQESIKIEIIEQININSKTSENEQLEEERDIKREVVVGENKNKNPKRRFRNVKSHFSLIKVETDSLKSAGGNATSNTSLVRYDVKGKASSVNELRCHRKKVLNNDALKDTIQSGEYAKPLETESNLHIYGSIHGINGKLCINEKQYVCNKCGKAFTELRRFNAHLRIHSAKKRYVCGECDKRFINRSNLIVHVRTHTGKKPYVCNICDKKFASSSNMKYHLQNHSGEKRYACDKCSKRFVQRHSLVEHMRAHTGEKPYICNQCGKKYTQQFNLDIHIRTHTGEKPYVCNICDKKFISPRNLKSHLVIHSDEKKYVCDQCNKRFTHNYSLVSHIRTHTGEKPYVCNRCDKKFSSTSNLNAHLKTHSDEKKYVCDQCSKRFTFNHSLVKHIRTHTGEKPYVCDHCSKGFARYDTLFLHIRTHTGDKPHACNVCDRKFATSYYLKLHLKSHSVNV